MALIDTKDLQDQPVEDIWNRGWYLCTVVKAQENENRSGKSLMLTLRVEEDVTGHNDFSVVGEQFSDFIQVTGMESHKDGGRFARQRLAKLLKAADLLDEDEVEAEDFLNKELAVNLRQGKDRDGLPQNQVSAYASPDFLSSVSGGSNASEYV
jgi:hypothetical protein